MYTPCIDFVAKSTKALKKLTLPNSDGLLITFANSLDPDQTQQDVGLDLDPNCLNLNDVFFLLKKVILKVSR